MISFTESEIHSMNRQEIWRDQKIIIKKSKNNDLYYIYPTGYADMNGRVYMALPIDVNVNDQRIRKQYNLI
jgi:hypothetical protein